MTASRRQVLGVLLALGFWLVNLSLHLKFSNWIAASVDTPFGTLIPLDYLNEVTAGVLLLGLGLLVWRTLSGANRVVTLLYWLLWLAAASACSAWLITTRVEIIHFLQYGILAWLVARALDPGRTRWLPGAVIGATVLLGIVDECNQYFFLTPNNSSYMDFNDFLLNQLGAAAGVLAFYGFERPPSRLGFAWLDLHAWLLGVCLALALGVGMLFATGTLYYTPDASIPPGGRKSVDEKLQIYLQREAGLLGSWQESFSGGQYYVLGGGSGTALLLLSTLCFAAFRPVSIRLRPKI